MSSGVGPWYRLLSTHVSDLLFCRDFFFFLKQLHRFLTDLWTYHGPLHVTQNGRALWLADMKTVHILSDAPTPTPVDFWICALVRLCAHSSHDLPVLHHVWLHKRNTAQLKDSRSLTVTPCALYLIEKGSSFALEPKLHSMWWDESRLGPWQNQSVTGWTGGLAALRLAQPTVLGTPARSCCHARRQLSSLTASGFHRGRWRSNQYGSKSDR